MRLRQRGLIVLTVLLGVVLLGLAPQVRAASVAALESQAQTDFIPELRLAAALALVPAYVATKSIEELEAIAGDPNKMVEWRIGAAEALRQLYIKGATAGTVDLAKLMDVAANGATAQLRAAADGALVDRLLAAEETDLAALAAEVAGENPELGFLKAEAVVIGLRGALASGAPDEILATAESVAGGGTEEVGGVTLDGSSEAMQRAMAVDFLSGFYIQFGHLVFDDLTAALLDRAVAGATMGLRLAASIALEAVYLNGLSRDELEELARTGGSAELREAAGRVLAQVLTADALAGTIGQLELVGMVVANTAWNTVVAEAAAQALAALLAAN